MEKQKITVQVAGRDYTLISSDPPEYMRRVAEYADRTISELAAATRLPSAAVSVLACLNLADELMKSQDDNSRLRRQLEALQEKAALE